MEMAIGSHSSVTKPAFSLSTKTHLSSRRSFGFSASFFKKPFFGCTSSSFSTKKTISRTPIQKSIKCSVSEATETTAGNNNIYSFLFLNSYFLQKYVIVNCNCSLYQCKHMLYMTIY